ncbi:MAG: 16S rRNA (cytidine(1402)-2'-O)-methyltransferase [Candidatus Latescibacteria bacterium]|nr:16S rRNA (cytidine(1402)-2'-O)-methyltransferase [bacterium]MBD3423173.1 16S rRNA (cytidine(1402)-2'-O)-methyltransferase [Candidatus Latescibacterota bacterium]
MRSYQFYLVSTPIGNLGDISERAIEVLKGVDEILSEDKRKAGVLLSRYGIGTKLGSYHDHNKEKVTPSIMERIAEGVRFALISDAGTPVISDPGYYIVRELIRNGIDFTAIPGPTSITDALVLSGLPPDRFSFLGYLPRKKGKRDKMLIEVGEREETIILFESPFRLLKTLQAIDRLLGDRDVVIARELTKMHEEVRRGSARELMEHFQGGKIRGELTVLIRGLGRRK